MANMTFLSVLNNAMGYRNTAGTGTLTASTTVAYLAGHWAGTTGIDSYNYPQGLYTTDIDDSADPEQGSAVIRCERLQDSGAVGYLLTLGEVDAGSTFLGVRVSASDNLDLYHRGVSDSDHTMADGAITLNQDMFVYVEWDASTVGLLLDTGTMVTTTRTGSSQAWGTGAEIGIHRWKGNTALRFRGRTDAVAIFDDKLTASERAYLRLTEEPWTWEMEIPAPTQAYVETVPSNGTREDAPVLIVV